MKRAYTSCEERKLRQDDRVMQLTNNLYIIVGPSYSGKTTLATRLEDIGYRRALTCTTRAPRGPEDRYIFLDTPAFQDLIEKDLLLEHTTYSGNQYGVLKSEVAISDFCILEPRVAHAVKQYCEEIQGRGVRLIGLTVDWVKLQFRFAQDPSHGIERLHEDQLRFKDLESWCDFTLETITPEQAFMRVKHYIEREEGMVVYAT